MIRAIIVIMLAVVCGSAAAIGVFQMVSKRTQQVESERSKTQTVVVASRTIDRGSVLSPADVKMVDWPKESVLSGTESHVENVIGRVVLVSFVQNEPLLKAKLSRDEGVSFFSSIIKMGMRAYTIQTTGPSSTVAGFVRPGDRVDVMLHLRGSTSDETGGGSTTTLLQAIEILAVDQILDPNADRDKMWAKGSKLSSVSLLVTPEQALLLALGQTNGELSLSLRNSKDTDEAYTQPATIKRIRYLQLGPNTETVSIDLSKSGDEENIDNGNQPGKFSENNAELLVPSRPVTYIRTLRNSQSGRVPVVRVP